MLGSLEISNITKSFGQHCVLDQVSVSVKPGEFITILGPSGCGKSTLLRVVAGLDDQDSGSIQIGGRAVDDVGPKDRGVAFVFQNYALYPHLTSRGNIAAPLVMRELNAVQRLPFARYFMPGTASKQKNIEERVIATANLLDIEQLLERKPSQLSGGQRQRVALGRALVREPDLFLLDEPFANLDAALRNRTRSELASLQKRLGTTTVFVTHDQSEALAMSDRIAVMFDGRIRQVATPAELYSHPVDLDVARFMSQPHLNCIPGHAVVSGHVSIADHHIPLDNAVQAGVDGVVGFRPEHCTLSLKASPGALPGVIARVEHAGPDAHVFVRMPAMMEFCVVRIPSANMFSWTKGASCFVKVDPHAAWFFTRAEDVEAVTRPLEVEAA